MPVKSVMSTYGSEHEKCKVFLSKCKEEVCLNPDADVTPYTHMLADEFRKWNRAWEKGFISTLFLELYEQVAQPLRRDLCKLEPRKVLCELKALDTAKDRFPRREFLTGCLLQQRGLVFLIRQGMLSPYLGGDFTVCGQVEIDQIRQEIDRGKYEIDRRKYDIDLILSEFKEEVCRDPDTDVTPFSDRLVHEYNITKSVCMERLIKTLFLNLYGEDAQSLERDIFKANKLKVMPEVTLEQRSELLPSLYGALSSYIGEDFSPILAMCDGVEDWMEL